MGVADARAEVGGVKLGLCVGHVPDVVPGVAQRPLADGGVGGGARDESEAARGGRASETEPVAERDEELGLLGRQAVERGDEAARVDARVAFADGEGEGAPMDVVEEAEELWRSAERDRLVEGAVARHEQRLRLEEPDRTCRGEEVFVGIIRAQGERRAVAGQDRPQLEVQGERAASAAVGEGAERDHGVSAGELTDRVGEHGREARSG